MKTKIRFAYAGLLVYAIAQAAILAYLFRV